ncbi:hypothetical protein CEV33_3908 [Brucella grignonensis]|uniref:Uncharacterized protein n=1 Tax=Brucella grignonensis TaxID=94627 RepID=A0A256FSP1_9HYPH|nr:hypothetical protein CEV33_3908 [Brucella grignonensis]
MLRRQSIHLSRNVADARGNCTPKPLAASMNELPRGARLG